MEAKTLSPIYVGPLKGMKYCMTCSKSSLGHIRNLKNIAIKSSIYRDMLIVLDLDDALGNIDKFCICDPCVRVLKKFIQMRTTLHEKIAADHRLQRQKQGLVHSVSPASKKLKPVKDNLPIRKGTTKEQILKYAPPSSKTPAEGMLAPQSDHQYFCQSKESHDTRAKKLLHESIQAPYSDHQYFSLSNEQTSAKEINDTSDKRVFQESKQALHCDHQYFSQSNKQLTVKEIYTTHHRKLLKEIHFQDDLRSFIYGMKSLPVDNILSELLKIDSVNNRIWQMFLIQISSDLNMLCGLENKSILRTKMTEHSPDTFQRDILQEMHERCPRALEFLITMCTPVHLHLSDECHVVAAMYAMAMYIRNPQLLAFQKEIAVACIKNSCKNGLLGTLHKFGMCIPERSKQRLMDELEQLHDTEILEDKSRDQSQKVKMENVEETIDANPSLCTEMEYRCGICKDLTFKSKYQCTLHLKEQHSGIVFKCNLCNKIFRTNHNPHKCKAGKEDYILFNQSTGVKGEDARKQLDKFMKRIDKKIIVTGSNGQGQICGRKRRVPGSVDTEKKRRLEDSTGDVISESHGIELVHLEDIALVLTVEETSLEDDERQVGKKMLEEKKADNSREEMPESEHNKSQRQGFVRETEVVTCMKIKMERKELEEKTMKEERIRGEVKIAEERKGEVKRKLEKMIEERKTGGEKKNNIEKTEDETNQDINRKDKTEIKVQEKKKVLVQKLTEEEMKRLLER